MNQVTAMIGITALVIAWRIIQWIRREQHRAIPFTAADEERLYLESIGANCRAKYRPCDGCQNGCGCYGEE
jgi:hypothetical protein